MPSSAVDSSIAEARSARAFLAQGERTTEAFGFFNRLVNFQADLGKPVGNGQVEN